MKPISALGGLIAFAALWAFSAPAVAAQQPDPPPKSPAESLAVLHPKANYVVDLVASEPLVLDPVAIDWGPDGRLWVAEMADYPLGMDGNMKPGGRIRTLEDTNGDGTYDRSTLFLENVNFPTGILVWRSGVLVTAPPDLFYAEDTDGDGRADVRQTLYTGFTEANPQLRANGLRWGLDNWVYCANGLGSKGMVWSVRTGENENLAAHDVRFRPDKGRIDLQSGPAEFGRNRDDWGSWFGVNNTKPLWHYVLADHYLRRNPNATPPDPKAQLILNRTVYPARPPEKRYHSFGDAGRFTSACSSMVYRDELLFPRGAEQHAFICEPQHYLVHHAVLAENGVTFTARRDADEQTSEFLASEDRWFRPVMTRTGPDGALWVVDMYRYVIEHPQWLPAQGQQELGPFYRAGEDRGRLYRVYPQGQAPRSVPRLDALSGAGLVAALDSPNGWQRDMVQRMLIWKNDPSTVAPLENLVLNSANPLARLHALCALDGLGNLKAQLVQTALADPHPAVRRHALRLAEPRAAGAPSLIDAAVALVDDPDLKVILQLAFTLGEWNDPRADAALATLALRHSADPYISAAVQSSMGPGGGLPLSWANRDVGSVAAAGSASASSGTFTVSGSGADIWGASDGFHYAYLPLTGDGEITARVASQENTDGWAKAGVMIRERLSGGSIHASVLATPANGIRFERRLLTGGSSFDTAGPSFPAPYWVRLTRSGFTLSAYASSDGSTWSLIGTETIPMAAQVFAGLAVTSHNDGALGTATMDGVATVNALDTDGDGMNDASEQSAGLDPSDGDEDGNGVADGLDDWDGDGIENWSELAGGTSPGSPPGPPPPPPPTGPYGLESRPPAVPYLNFPTDETGSIPPTLSATGAFTDVVSLTPDPALIPYDVISPLWSDRAMKRRWIALPTGVAITFFETSEWSFPAGTVLVKHFELALDETRPGERIRLETRFLVVKTDGSVYGVTYKWRLDESGADLLPGSLSEPHTILQAGGGTHTQTWYYPGRTDCLTCHTPAAKYVLGVQTLQLNRDWLYGSGVTDNQLRTWNHIGMFDTTLDEGEVVTYDRLSRIDDPLAGAERRVRSYLHSNCAQCHRPSGPSQGLFDARFVTPLSLQNLINGAVVAPVGSDNERVVAPKDVWRSALYLRMSVADGTVQMPPLARNQVDRAALAAVVDWINGLSGTEALHPPDISPDGGVFDVQVQVALGHADPQAELRYTLDVTDPTASSPLYSGPFLLTADTVVIARAFRNAYVTSSASTAIFTLSSGPPGAAAAMPLITPNGGRFQGSVSITLSTATAGATLRTTLDGTDPTVDSREYTGPFVLDSLATLRARAFKSGLAPSPVSRATFLVEPGPPATGGGSGGGGGGCGSTGAELLFAFGIAWLVRLTLKRSERRSSPRTRWSRGDRRHGAAAFRRRS